MNPLALRQRPTKAQLNALPTYAGVQSNRVYMVNDASDVADDVRKITHSPIIGFDTESRPNFKPGEARNPIALVQIASPHGVVLFRVTSLSVIKRLKAVLESNTQLKVGFGLKSDRKDIKHQLGIELKNTQDLCASFVKYGIKDKVGAQSAVALVFGQKLQKSKRVQLSNWAAKTLSEPQKMYAANDAYSAIEVYLKLQGSL